MIAASPHFLPTAPVSQSCRVGKDLNPTSKLEKLAEQLPVGVSPWLFSANPRDTWIFLKIAMLFQSIWI